MKENPKRQAILDAAYEQFCQYGFRKTSMDDIARGSGISRPSLYSHFENKDEIFRCVSISIHENALEEAHDLLNECTETTLIDRVTGALLARHGPFQTAIVSYQHGAELHDEYSRLCGDIVTQSHQRFETMLASALRKASRLGEIDLKNGGHTASAVAELLNLAAAGLKRGAMDSKRFENRVMRLTRLAITGLQAPKDDQPEDSGQTGSIA